MTKQQIIDRVQSQHPNLTEDELKEAVIAASLVEGSEPTRVLKLSGNMRVVPFEDADRDLDGEEAQAELDARRAEDDRDCLDGAN